ncbi:MAG: glycosyltransferase [Candidatus Sericytochromatia bacterium]|nr:glycosyltransferase [Candidatus Tanganyikabacteria bacterium]
MLDYFAAGLPVISTPFGARGLDVVAGEHAVLCELHEFPEALRALPAGDGPAMALRARDHARASFSWETIGAGLAAKLATQLQAAQIAIAP